MSMTSNADNLFSAFLATKMMSTQYVSVINSLPTSSTPALMIQQSKSGTEDPWAMAAKLAFSLVTLKV